MILARNTCAGVLYEKYVGLQHTLVRTGGFFICCQDYWLAFGDWKEFFLFEAQMCCYFTASTSNCLVLAHRSDVRDF